MLYALTVILITLVLVGLYAYFLAVARFRELAEQTVQAGADRDTARSSEARARSELGPWKNMAAERQKEAVNLQNSVTTLRNELQATQNSAHEQAAQIRDRDRRLAEQARAAELAKEDIVRAAKKEIAEALGKANQACMERDQAVKAVRAARGERDLLAAAVQAHRTRRGHGQYQRADDELYAAAGLGPAEPPAPLPPMPPPVLDEAGVQRMVELLKGKELSREQLLWLGGLGFVFAHDGFDGIGRATALGTFVVNPSGDGPPPDELNGMWHEAVAEAQRPDKRYRFVEG